MIYPTTLGTLALAVLAMACSGLAPAASAQGTCDPAVKTVSEDCGRLGLKTTYVDVTNTCSCPLSNIAISSPDGVQTIALLNPRETKRRSIKICASTEGAYEKLTGTLSCSGQQTSAVSKLKDIPVRAGGAKPPSVDSLLGEFGQKPDVSAETKAKVDAIVKDATSKAADNLAEDTRAKERAEDAELRKRRAELDRARQLDLQRRAATARTLPPRQEPIIGSNPYNAPTPPAVAYCTLPGYLQCASSRCPGNPAACAARCACE